MRQLRDGEVMLRTAIQNCERNRLRLQSRTMHEDGLRHRHREDSVQDLQERVRDALPRCLLHGLCAEDQHLLQNGELHRVQAGLHDSLQNRHLQNLQAGLEDLLQDGELHRSQTDLQLQLSHGELHGLQTDLRQVLQNRSLHDLQNRAGNPLP